MQAGTQASDWDKHKQSHFSRLSHSTREKKVQFGGQRGKEKQVGSSKNTKENKQKKQEKVF